MRLAGVAGDEAEARVAPARRLPGCIAALLIVYPLVATPFFTFQVGAYALILGTIALSLMFLAGYGGMVSLSQMSAAGLAGYVVAIFGYNSLGSGFDWPWWLVVPVASAGRHALLGRRRAPRRPHRGHLHDHDHARDRRSPSSSSPSRTTRSSTATAALPGSRRRSCSASTGATPVPVLLSRAVRRRALLLRRPLHRPDRRSASPCRRSATIPAACGRSASMSPPIASPPRPSPASSPRSAACSSSGSTAASRRAPSASTA